jgi:hypothetical protein
LRGIRGLERIDLLLQIGKRLRVGCELLLLRGELLACLLQRCAEIRVLRFGYGALVERLIALPLQRLKQAAGANLRLRLLTLRILRG